MLSQKSSKLLDDLETTVTKSLSNSTEEESFKTYAGKYLRIRTKLGRLRPLNLNHMQKKIDATIEKLKAAGKMVRIIILKYRQGGCSTYVEGRVFENTSKNELVTSLIIAHEEEASTNLFNMSKLYFDELPNRMKPLRKASNAKELIFENPTLDPFEKKKNPGLRSRIRISTAKNIRIGRSDTIQNVHASELAFWPDAKKTMLSIMQAVPDTLNTMVFLESTAQGVGGYFYDMWQKAVLGENEFVPLFFAWFEEPDYRMPVPPELKLTKEEKKLKETYNLDDEQLVWRRWCIANKCGGDAELFKQEYPSNPDEAFLTSGRPVFNREKIILRKEQLKRQYEEIEELKANEEMAREHLPRRGKFRFKWNNPETRDKILDESIEWVDDPKGPITIYEDRQPGYPYVIGGDTKGEGRDYYAGKGLNNVTGKRCFALRMQVSNSKPYTWQMYCAGRYFNTALIGIEMNWNTGPIEELERLNYPRQYTRQHYDSFTKQYQKKYGWKTDGNTRPLIIDKEIDLIENNIDLFTDLTFLDECLTFVYTEPDNRPDAQTGCHDDLIFADMIANEIRPQQSFFVEPQRRRPDYDDDEDDEKREEGNWLSD